MPRAFRSSSFTPTSCSRSRPRDVLEVIRQAAAAVAKA
jgi:hypothetical protein